jgi:hypothetical protein
MAYSEKHPSGAKAHVDFAAFTAVRAKALTYQSCPVTKPLYTKNEIALGGDSILVQSGFETYSFTGTGIESMEWNGQLFC